MHGDSHSSLTDVAAPLKRPHRHRRGFNHKPVPEASVQPRISLSQTSGYSCRTPRHDAYLGLKVLVNALATDPFYSGVWGAVNSRQIPRLLQLSTRSPFEYSVLLSVRKMRRTPVSSTKRFTAARMEDALFSRVPYGWCSRGVPSANITTCQDNPSDASYGPAVSMWTRSSGLVARPVERCGLHARCHFALEQAEHETNSLVKRITCCFAVPCQDTGMGICKVNIQMVNVYPLTMLKDTGVQCDCLTSVTLGNLT